MTDIHGRDSPKNIYAADQLINSTHNKKHMNNTTFILGIIIALGVGAIGGYTAGQKKISTVYEAQVQEMTDMMKADGERMEKMGGMMMDAGKMMEERGMRSNDQEMVMEGKDLGVNGKKHLEDGKSMTGGDMMGMTADGNMDDMPGMDHSNMKM
jgi:hypothetical protein